MHLVHAQNTNNWPAVLENDGLCLYEDILEAGFLTLKARFLVEGHDEEEAERLTAICWPNLLEVLYAVVEPTLMAHYLLAETDLDGETPVDKWLTFTTLLKDEAIKDYFDAHYPLLGERIKRETAQWVVHCHRLVRRFHADRERLATELFGTSDTLQLNWIQTNAGDKHDGASVSIVGLDGGKNVVYIPRERPQQLHFNSLCAWIDDALNVGLRRPQFVEGDGYGWMAFIPHTTCTREAQVVQFYHRTGVYLALLYTLEATDFHYENLIAWGEYPVLIDVETLFHPFMPYEYGDNRHTLYNSVLKTGLLPTGFSTDGQVTADLSGLSNPAGRPGPASYLQFKWLRSGFIKGIRQAGTLKGGFNCPTLNHQPVTFSRAHAEALKKGFREAYTYLMNHKGPYLEQIHRFRNDTVRLLFRPTAAYTHVLKEGLHPDALRQTEQTERLLNHLDLVVEDYPDGAAFLEAEKEALRQGNIPCFFTSADGRDLRHKRGLIAEVFFHTSGYQTAVDKIRHLSQQDLERQSWIIDMSLSTFGIKALPSTERLPSRVAEPSSELAPGPNASDYWLNKAIELTEGLRETMHEEQDSLSWMVCRPSNLDASRYVLTPAAYDLYSGMPGELLLFTYLAQQTGRSRYTELATKTWQELSLRLQHGNGPQNLGLFGGWGGLLYTMALLYKQKGDSRWLEEARRLLRLTKPGEWAAREKSHGLVNGTAGFIVACLSMYKVSKEAPFLAMAEKKAAWLLRKAMHNDKHLRWTGHNKQPLAGLSHGASGFALAFGRLYHATGTKRYKEVVKKILNYEQYLYDPVQRNWPDLRDFILKQGDGRPSYPVAWSHGACGIGLARMELLKCGIRCQSILNDLDIALETCLKEGFNQGYSLCFGSFGNLELLLNHAVFTGRPEVWRSCYDLAKHQLKEGLERHFLFQGGGVRCPGMMNGATGIAYQCLRLHDATKVPSILTAAI